MDYCPFPSLGHDTVHCIVTQGVGARSRVATTRQGGPAIRPHDTTNMGHDTTDRAQGLTEARARADCLDEESRYKCCIMARGDF